MQPRSLGTKHLSDYNQVIADGMFLALALEGFKWFPGELFLSENFFSDLTNRSLLNLSVKCELEAFGLLHGLAPGCQRHSQEMVAALLPSLQKQTWPFMFFPSVYSSIFFSLKISSDKVYKIRHL